MRQSAPLRRLALKFNTRRHILTDVAKNAKRDPGDRMQTEIFKQAGPTTLCADIYLPDVSQLDGSTRPVGM